MKKKWWIIIVLALAVVVIATVIIVDEYNTRKGYREYNIASYQLVECFLGCDFFIEGLTNETEDGGCLNGCSEKFPKSTYYQMPERYNDEQFYIFADPCWSTENKTIQQGGICWETVLERFEDKYPYVIEDN